MRHELQNDKLILFFEGELNSYNSEDVEKQIETIIKSNSFKSIEIDMRDLSYISSAGLRIIARLKQQFDDTYLVNVPDGVYEILDMVGFQNIIKISKLK